MIATMQPVAGHWRGRPDSAFYHLFRLAEKANYTNLGHLTTDPDLQPIHQDERWQQLISRVEANKKPQKQNSIRSWRPCSIPSFSRTRPVVK